MNYCLKAETGQYQVKVKKTVIRIIYIVQKIVPVFNPQYRTTKIAYRSQAPPFLCENLNWFSSLHVSEVGANFILGVR